MFRKATVQDLINKAAALEKAKKRAVNMKLPHSQNLDALYEYEETRNLEREMELNQDIPFSFLKEKIMGLSW